MPVSRQPTDRTIRIPTDAATVAEALEQSRNPTQRTDILFQSGYVITERTEVESRDFRHVRIRAEDEVVPASGDGDYFSFLVGARGTFLPIVDCLVDMQGSARGIKLTEGSTGIVLARESHRTGVINASGRNLFVYRGSSFYAVGKREENLRCEFTGAGDFGLFCYRGSWATVTNADFSGAGREGIRAKSDSWVAANESIVRDCGHNGAHANNGARIGVSDHAIIKGSGGYDLKVSGHGEITAYNSNFDTMNRNRWFSAWPLGDKGRIYHD